MERANDQHERSQKASETWSKISDVWHEFTATLPERQYEEVQRLVSERTQKDPELQQIEESLSRTGYHFGEFCRLCSRFLKLYSEIIRESVIEVRFGLKPRTKTPQALHP